ncbi:hypothetical protein ACIRP7_31275 [Streptomyces sp. NPDC102270]|uniref:hypothetical protein n=1 Tax=Streptomyces sp. NPDC102270 TaxID=3366150 RepID=UPI003800DB2F
MPAPFLLALVVSGQVAPERDDRVLDVLTESLGLFVRRHPGHAAGAGGCRRH